MNKVLDGVNRLLEESIDLQGAAANETIVVGGWGPYLRNFDKHPGTKDVDILFPKSYSRDDIASVTREFLRKKFLLSAKHDFQLFRNYQIGQHSYIFNVDLLHPTIQKENRAEFMDVIDLDITFDGHMVKKIRTICIVGGDLFFEHKMYVKTSFRGRTFNTLSPAGVILSKIPSCRNAKRSRDIFDILLSLRETPDAGKLVLDLASQYSNVDEMIASYREHLSDKWQFYAECLKEFGVNGDRKTQMQLIELT